jgi:tRNA A-37 threonylcarbamoyl transferase component Bud32/tetratricopeptide (TPR) repeat protein
MTPHDPPNPSPSTAALLQLVEECIDRMEAEGSQVIEDLCARHPEHAAALRKRLKSLAHAGLLPAAEAGPGMPEGVPERLGEFRLLQRLGGGGMGVVFLAEQESLHRRVAIKMVRPEHLFFPSARERFRREVEAVARLQHPGIVPVYLVDEHQGIPFYAMEHVAGCSLAEARQDLRSLPLDRLDGRMLAEVVARRAGLPAAPEPLPPTFQGGWVETCLRLVRQVASALEHAHERGVLHRDLKPSNLMLTPDGRMRIVDFGLASTRGSSRMTREGSLLGSIPYMAPERLRGEQDQLSAATDVYGLGVTLYELLAGRPPFWGEDSEVTRSRVLTGEFPPLRSLNAAVPRDAETVCLKAMDRDPKRRYPTMAGLAQDLANVLEFRPIRGERAGLLVRARRWSQRHPARATGVVLGGLLLVAGPLGYGVSEARARRTIENALQDAQRERGRAERNTRSALQAVDEMLSRVGAKDLVDVPFMEEVRRDLLERALRFLTPLLDEGADDPRIQRETGVTHMRLGLVHGLLGHSDEERRNLERAVELLTAARQRLGGEFEVGIDLARGLLAKGAALYNQQDGLARACLERSVALWESLLTDLPGARVEDLEGMARAHVALSLAMRAAGEIDAAKTMLATWMERVAPASSADPDDGPPGRTDLRIDYLARLGALCHHGHRFHDATDYLQRCDRLLTRILSREPRSRAHLERQHEVRYLLSTVHLQKGEDDEGLLQAEAALATADRLVAMFPARVRYRANVAYSRNALGSIHLVHERFAEALPDYRAALGIMERLVTETPKEQSFQDFLATIRTNLATVAMRSGRTAEALAQLDALITYRRQRVGERGDAVDAPALLAFCLELRVELDWDAEDYAAACPRLLECVQSAQLALSRNPKHPGALPMFRKRVRTLADAFLRSGAAGQVEATAQTILDGPKARGEEARGAASFLCRVAEALVEQDPEAATEPTLRMAVAAAGAALERGYDDPDELRSAPDLARIRSRPDFRALFTGGAASRPASGPTTAPASQPGR